MKNVEYTCECLRDDKIEVYRFGVTAEKITAHQLEALGADGFALTDSWKLNEEDYGPNQRFFIFERFAQ